MSELVKQAEEKRERDKIFEEGFRFGLIEAKKAIKRNEILQNFLLEFMGYEEEWLRRKAFYQKYNKSELTEIIFEQRALMKTLFDNIETSKQEEFKIKIDNFLATKY